MACANIGAILIVFAAGAIFGFIVGVLLIWLRGEWIAR